MGSVLYIHVRLSDSIATFQVSFASGDEFTPQTGQIMVLLL